MQIITPKQVEYCQVIHPDEENAQPSCGVLYKEKLFSNIATYAKDQIQEAISYGREEFLVERGSILVLVIEEDTRVTVWKEDKELKLVEKEGYVVGKINLNKLVEIMRNLGGVQIKDRPYHLKTYRRCFVGEEAVRWLKGYLNISEEEAVEIGQKLIDEKLIHHVLDEHSFENKYLFYRFYSDEIISKDSSS